MSYDFEKQHKFAIDTDEFTEKDKPIELRKLDSAWLRNSRIREMISSMK